jgi:preprotein translocase subunit YajC
MVSAFGLGWVGLIIAIVVVMAVVYFLLGRRGV